MSFFDVFNLSFVVYLGILILCLSLLFVYFESKLREQNHKMASILQIVSSLAQEVHSAPPPVTTSSIETTYPIQTFDDVKKVNASLELIDVSDGEEDDEEGYDEEEEEEDEAELEDLDESESELEDEDDDSDFEQDVSVLAEKLEIEPEEIEQDEQIEKNDPVTVVKIMPDSDLKPSFDEFNFLASADTEFKELDDFHVVSDKDDDAHSISSDFGEKEDKVDEIKSEDLKSIILSANISVHDGSKSADEGSVMGDEFTKDFKKMSQNKLKKLAIEKGLIQESSKLKKPELISLLERSL